jgi:hypothetical protein
LISAISPEKSASGPEITLTDSPIENWARVRGRSAVSRCRSLSTSTLDRGIGLFRDPTKPVTPGVFLTSPQESSVISMFTST